MTASSPTRPCPWSRGTRSSAPSLNAGPVWRPTLWVGVLACRGSALPAARCRECRGGRENLCERAVFTGYTRDGGYADYVTAEHRFCFPIPDRYGDLDAAPLLCAGLIGYRAYRMAGDAPRLGLYGFGAAAHILAQLAHHEGREVYAFTRPGDRAGQDFARTLGAVWASGSDQRPPVDLDAAILFAPVGELVPTALRAVGAGGTVVCAGIHMSDIPSFPYAWLWRERVIRSVANLTREDGHAFMHAIAAAPVATHVSEFPLPDANRAPGRRAHRPHPGRRRARPALTAHVPLGAIAAVRASPQCVKPRGVPTSVHAPSWRWPLTRPVRAARRNSGARGTPGVQSANSARRYMPIPL